jgi:putative methionine-R-sulfoxide reductase with GAF domain
MTTGHVPAFDAFAEIALRIHEGQAPLTEVLDLIAQSATELLRTDIAWLVLADADQSELRPVVLVGFSSGRFLELSLPMDRGVVGQALSRRTTIVVEDYATYDHPTSAAVRGVIDQEGIRSLICCPLFRAEQSIGALYVARRRPSSFPTSDLRLLEALAGQASVAIRNQRLYGRLREQNDLLERSLQIHRRFTEASLRGVGLKGMAEILLALVAHPVRITPHVLGAQEITVPEDADLAAAGSGTVEVIKADGRVLGTVQVFHREPLSPLDITAVEHARTVCGLELVKAGLAAEVERRFSSRLLDDLLDTRADSLVVAERARRFGLDLDQDFRFLVVQADVHGSAPEVVDDVVRTALQVQLVSSRSQALLTKRAGRLVVAVPAVLDQHVPGLTTRIQAGLVEAGSRASVGVGPMLPDLTRGHATAEACAALAERSSAAGDVRVVHYDDLGLLNFLLDAPSVDHARAAVSSWIEPLRDHDRASPMQLLPTLQEYLANDGHHGRTCGRLFIGITTLKYRLGRIAELLDVDLRDGQVRFQLRLALHLHGLLEAREKV